MKFALKLMNLLMISSVLKSIHYETNVKLRGIKNET